MIPQLEDVNGAWINQRGNQVVCVWQGPFADRYRWDFNGESDWEQFDTDQDAPYFGVWVNKKTLQTRTYCEGDLTIVSCPDVEHFNAEIEDALKFYRPGFVAKALDVETGQWTIYRQDRDSFFVESTPPLRPMP